MNRERRSCAQMLRLPALCSIHISAILNYFCFLLVLLSQTKYSYFKLFLNRMNCQNTKQY